MNKFLENKTLLITGGTGSFGNAVLQKFISSDIKEIRIFSRDEKKQDDMRIGYRSEKLKFYIGDVREYSSILEATRGVDFIFHAAALKQVPSCEFYPMEAYRTNVLGTENAINAAIECCASRFVLLSTDKAVYPINAMGISKAMAEKVMIAKSRQLSSSQTVICATRYGNVMASRGSVIPLFLKQIRSNQNLTITDPNMTRFLMSLNESVELVIHAFKNANQGDIFIQKASASTVGDLAEAMMQLFGDGRSSIKVIGTRHGEKLFESLVSREEMANAEDMGGFYRIKADNRDLNYEKFFSDGESKITTSEDYTSHNAVRLDVQGIKNLINKLDLIKGS